MFVVERLHELQIWLLTAIEFLPPTWWLLPGIIRSVEWKLGKLGTVSREGPLPCDTPWPDQPGCQWFCNAELIEPRNNAKRWLQIVSTPWDCNFTPDNSMSLAKRERPRRELLSRAGGKRQGLAVWMCVLLVTLGMRDTAVKFYLHVLHQLVIRRLPVLGRLKYGPQAVWRGPFLRKWKHGMEYVGLHAFLC